MDYKFINVWYGETSNYQSLGVTQNKSMNFTRSNPGQQHPYPQPRTVDTNII